MKLYEIANEYQSLFNALDEAQGDEKIAINECLDKIKLPLESKAVNVAKYIQGLRSSQTMIDQELLRLQRMKRVLDQREISMMDYLSFNMATCGIEKIESALFKIQFKLCPPKVDVIDADLIPQEYKKTKTEVTIDKVKIKNEIKEGVVIPGVALIQDKKLEIK